MKVSLKNILAKNSFLLLSIIVIVIALMSCNRTVVNNSMPCLTKITYYDIEDLLAPPFIKVDFIDVDTLIGKRAKAEGYSDIIFYSLGKDSSKFFWLKPNYFEHKGDTTSLLLSVSYFVREEGDGLTPKAIESLLIKGGVGLVAGSDTTNLRACQVLDKDSGLSQP